MTFTLSQAAKEAGKSKSIISAAIKGGRLSASRQEDGSFQIEPAELFRVFPARTAEQPEPASRTRAGTVPEHPAKPDETAVLRERVSHLEAALQRERDERAAERAKAENDLADARRSRDAAVDAMTVAQAMAREAVAAFPKQISGPVTSPPRRRWGLW